MAKNYDGMEFDIKLGNEPTLLGASDEHDNAYPDVGELP